MPREAEFLAKMVEADARELFALTVTDATAIVVKLARSIAMAEMLGRGPHGGGH